MAINPDSPIAHEVAARLRAGIPIRQVAAQYRRSYQWVQQVTAGHDVPPRVRGRPKVHLADLRAAEAEGIDQSTLADRLKLHPDTVRRACRRHGVALPTAAEAFAARMRLEAVRIYADGYTALEVADQWGYCAEWVRDALRLHGVKVLSCAERRQQGIG